MTMSNIEVNRTGELGDLPPFQRTAARCACLLFGLFVGCSIADRASPGEARIPDESSVGRLAKLALSNEPTSLLAGRLTLKMPAAAKVEPRRRSIMAAPESSEEETRVVLDAKKERLVLMAGELYALMGDDFEKAVRAEVAKSWGEKASTVKVEKLAVAPPLVAVAVLPPPPECETEAQLVLGVYVGNGDGTVQFLAFYVNPEGAKDAAGMAALARESALTLSAGTRRLTSKAGDRSFAGVGNDRLVITVPEGFVASTTEGPDFSVYELHKLSPLGQPASSCGIYLGRHPSYQYRQTDDPPDKVTRTKGRLLGRDAEWQDWSKAGRLNTEAIVSYPKSEGMAVHVFCSAASDDGLKALRAVAATLRVQRAKK
jgi:hypothetical protein